VVRTLAITWWLTLMVLPPAVSAQPARAAANGSPRAEDGLPVYRDWRTFGVKDGLPSDKVLCVLVDRNTHDVWAGTDKGLARRRGRAWTVFTPKEGLAYPVVSSLAVCEKTGDLWIGTFGGLSRFSAGRFDSFNQLNSGLINDVIYSVAVVRGKVWAATAAGVSVYDPEKKSWALYDHENTVMHEPWCYGLTAAADRVFIAVWGGGVVEHSLERNTWKAYRDPDHEMEIDLFRDDGLVHDITSAVSYADGILWVATYFGLSRFDGRLWHSYLDHDTPLPSNFINFVRARGRWAWIATDKGLAAFDGQRWIIYRRSENEAGGSIQITGGGAEPRSLATPSALGHNYVLGVDPQADCVWVATPAGLSVGSRGAERKGKQEAGKPAGKALKDR